MDKEILNQLIPQLNAAYSDEWLAYYQYFIESKVVEGLLRDSVIKELREHAEDEMRHANLVVDRIVELAGGQAALLDPRDIFEKTTCGYIKPTSFDTTRILQDSIEGEICAIKSYTKIAEFIEEHDSQTYDILMEIIKDEEEHRDDLKELQEEILASKNAPIIVSIKQQFSKLRSL